MNDLLFTPEHDWVRIDGGVATVGISDHAQRALGDLVFVELPEIGAVVARGEAVAVIESLKAATELCAPLSGTVTAVNAAVADQPGLVNDSPEDRGWIFRLALSDPAELDRLLDRAAYEARLGASENGSSGGVTSV